MEKTSLHGKNRNNMKHIKITPTTPTQLKKGDIYILISQDNSIRIKKHDRIEDKKLYRSGPFYSNEDEFYIKDSEGYDYIATAKELYKITGITADIDEEMISNIKKSKSWKKMMFIKKIIETGD